jgi:uncharacterized membrane protein
MIAIGVAHFVAPEPFVRIVPAWLPAPLALVYVSGAFEILGGAGLLVPRARRAAAIGLVALFVAVFPANVNQALHQVSFDDGPPPPTWALLLRLPFQIVLIAWAVWLARSPRATRHHQGSEQSAAVAVASIASPAEPGDPSRKRANSS